MPAVALQRCSAIAGISGLHHCSAIAGISGFHQHLRTFACPVFVLQNELASGKSLPRWSPCARLGLNLGPSSTHARNVYLLLNLLTGCVTPQYHCWFDVFFEMTGYGQPDVSDTICWKQLVGLYCAEQIPSNLAWPTQSSTVSQAGLILWMISPSLKWILTL